MNPVRTIYFDNASTTRPDPRVRDAILMDGVEIGRHCRIRHAIIDKNVHLPEGTVIGYDREADRRRFVVSPTGIVIIPKSPRRLQLREMNR